MEAGKHAGDKPYGHEAMPACQEADDREKLHVAGAHPGEGVQRQKAGKRDHSAEPEVLPVIGKILDSAELDQSDGQH